MNILETLRTFYTSVYFTYSYFEYFGRMLHLLYAVVRKYIRNDSEFIVSEMVSVYRKKKKTFADEIGDRDALIPKVSFHSLMTLGT